MDGAADVAETAYTPFRSKPDAAPVRLIVRRVKPTPGSQLPSSPATAITASSPTGTGYPGGGGRPSPPRRGRKCQSETSVRRGTQSSPVRPFRRQPAWLAVQVLAHNLARWTARIGLGEQLVTTKTLRRRFFSWPDGLPARRADSLCHLPRAGPGLSRPLSPWPDCEPSHSQPDGAIRNRPTHPNSRPPGPRVHPVASGLTITRFPAS